MTLEINIQDISLEEILDSENIADKLDDQSLAAVASIVKRKYQEDLDSCSEYYGQIRDIKELIKTAQAEKSTPWEGASNVKIPMVLSAAINFASRAYPLIVKDDVVKIKRVGEYSDEKVDRAKRVSQLMNFELEFDDEAWQSDTDKLLQAVALYGTMYRKTWFDPIRQSTQSSIIDTEDLIVNKDAKSLQEDDHTHRFYLHDWIIKERISTGLYVAQNKELEADTQYEILEQYTRIDLDGDGYPEPYIVTMNAVTEEVLSIAKRFDYEDVNYIDGELVSISAMCMITPYFFYHDPQGNFQGMGLGHLLIAINNTVNTSINQLNDAGLLSNVSGGFLAKGVRMKGGAVKQKMGQFTFIDTNGNDIRTVVMPIKHNEPSAVLYNLMMFLLDLGKNIGGMKDVLSGEINNANVTATTTLAMIDQAVNEFRSIFKRVYSSLKKEFVVVYKLNYKYLDDDKYQSVTDSTDAIVKVDFTFKDRDVIPVADLNDLTSMQKTLKAEQVMSLSERGIVDPKVAARRYLEALNVPDIDELMDYEPSNQELQLQQALIQRDTIKEQNRNIELQMEQYKMQQKDKEIAIKAAETNAGIGKTLAETGKIKQDTISGEINTIKEYVNVKESINARPNDGLED